MWWPWGRTIGRPPRKSARHRRSADTRAKNLGLNVLNGRKTVTQGTVAGTMDARYGRTIQVSNASLLAAHAPRRGTLRPSQPAAPVAFAGAQIPIRSRDRWRRRARPWHGLLPRQGAWPARRGRPREGMDRRG